MGDVEFMHGACSLPLTPRPPTCEKEDWHEPKPTNQHRLCVGISGCAVQNFAHLCVLCVPTGSLRVATDAALVDICIPLSLPVQQTTEDAHGRENLQAVK